MVFTRKERAQNKRLLSQLYESGTDFMSAQNIHEAQTESRSNAMEESYTSNKINNPTQTDSLQVDVHTLERSIVSKVRSEWVM